MGTNDVCIKSPVFLTEFNRREDEALLLKKQAMAHFHPQPPILIILVAEQQEKSAGQLQGSGALWMISIRECEQLNTYLSLCSDMSCSELGSAH